MGTREEEFAADEPDKLPPGLHLQRQKHVIGALQAGRALAALAVVFLHASVGTQWVAGGMPSSFYQAFGYGYLGVDFFFVLSGFIIYYTNRDVGMGWSGKYIESRIARIYVPYLPIGIAMAVAYTTLPNLSAGDREWSWLASATLLPTPRSTALSVAWTLRHEILFYGLFWVAVMTRRLWLLAALWALIIAGWNAFMGPPEGGLKYALSLINLEFIFGLIAAWAVSEKKGEWHWAIFAILASASFAGFWAVGANGAFSVLVGLGLSFIIVPLVRAERSGRIKVPAFALLLGNASYAIYLIHLPLISLGTRLFGTLNWAIIMALLVIGGTVAGLAYHLAFEKPALRVVRSLLARPGGSRPAS